MAAPEPSSVLTFSPPINRRRREELKGLALALAVGENGDDRLRSINCSLSAMGLHPVEASSVDSLVDALECLLLTTARGSSFTSQVQENAHLERIGRLEAEKDVLQQRVKQLAAALDAAERESAQKEDKLRSAISRANQQQRALEAEKAELTKEIGVLQHRDNQYLHEVRKKEREIEKIQKKLQAALGERGVKDTRGIELHGGVRVPIAATSKVRACALVVDVYAGVERGIRDRAAEARHSLAGRALRCAGYRERQSTSSSAGAHRPC